MATKQFLLPDLGEGLPDATIVEWFVKVGDTIRLDEALVSMETAKAVVEVPSPVSGKVLRLAGGDGDVIVTGTMLAEFEIDPSLPQRAEGQDTGHHHGAPAGAGAHGVGSDDPGKDDKVVASDEGGAISDAGTPAAEGPCRRWRQARRRRHRGRRDGEFRCGAQRSGGRRRRRQGDAGGARAGTQARRRSRPRAAPLAPRAR